ncbi:MAG: adenosylhomocysteinase [Ruminococcaceae bacterium]|nr:adenosylhomocysteinase [Oscillospiraceae bacterium]
MSDILDISLAPSGQDKINWVRKCMPVLSALEADFAKTKPLAGLKMAISIHLEAKTAYLAQTLRAAGADVSVTGCNPLSTQDDVAAALAAEGFEVNGITGASMQTYHDHLVKTLSCKPDLIIDDGGDFTELLHGERRDLAVNLIAGTEETTTGVHRLHARAAAGELRFPMMAVNDALCKYLFDNRYGTGQSVWAAILHVTNMVVASKTVVVAGYGWCGRGIAMRAAALGAKVIVTEVNPHRALEAAMDGYSVMTMDDAAALGDIFVTATGCDSVIRREHFAKMRDNVLLANAGHFDVEVNKVELAEMATEIRQRKPSIEGYYLPDGRVLNLLAEGRLVNLAAGMGHPAEIMDMSFAVQALSVVHLAQHGRELAPGVYNVPNYIDELVAKTKLSAMGLTIDTLSEEQKKYLGIV